MIADLYGKHFFNCQIRWMQRVWEKQKTKLDPQIKQVSMLLSIQENEAVWWRNACLLYFQAYSNLPICVEYEKPDQTVEFYKKLKLAFSSGELPPSPLACGQSFEVCDFFKQPYRQERKNIGIDFNSYAIKIVTKFYK